VKVTEKISQGEYKAVAHMDDGKTFELNISVKGKTLETGIASIASQIELFGPMGVNQLTSCLP
jgi:hypothetical protein